MLNIGPQELLLILVVALVVVGPSRLPEIARTLGKGVRELRKAQDEVRKTIQVGLEDDRPAHPKRPLPETPAAASAPEGAAAASGSETSTEREERTTPVEQTGIETGTAVSEISKTLGRSLAELRRAREEIQRSFRVDLDDPGSSAGAPSTAEPPRADPPIQEPPAP